MLRRTIKDGEEFYYVQILMEQQLYGGDVKIKQFLSNYMNSDFILDYFRKRTDYWISKLKEYNEKNHSEMVISTIHEYKKALSNRERWQNSVKLMILGEMIEHGQEI